MSGFETIIGLEVHCQLNTKTKIFCGCSTSFGEEPNKYVCPTCLALPGALPVLNKEAVKKAVSFGRAVKARVNKISVFDRKNYFYPDLPKAYQISQFSYPIVEAGELNISVNGETKRIGITRAHLEEDAGKNSHEAHSSLWISTAQARRCLKSSANQTLEAVKRRWLTLKNFTEFCAF